MQKLGFCLKVLKKSPLKPLDRIHIYCTQTAIQHIKACPSDDTKLIYITLYLLYTQNYLNTGIADLLEEIYKTVTSPKKLLEGL